MAGRNKFFTFYVIISSLKARKWVSVEISYMLRIFVLVMHCEYNNFIVFHTQKID